jgi:hypothetical protein
MNINFEHQNTEVVQVLNTKKRGEESVGRKQRRHKQIKMESKKVERRITEN